MELFDSRIIYHSPLAFTPFTGNKLQLANLRSELDRWFREAGIGPKDLFGGGVIVTGLAAETQNASALKEALKPLLGDSLFVTASDPHLESWLAFQGACYKLCLEFPEETFLNLDIGGGTTNWALGDANGVSSTGCAFVGARHFQIDPSHKILALSAHAKRLLKFLDLSKRVGQTLEKKERDQIVTCYVNFLEALVDRSVSLTQAELFQMTGDPLVTKIPFRITFSGGVGELVYDAEDEENPFGDLGGYLAAAILRSPKLTKEIDDFIPWAAGRATVIGLTLHHLDLSGHSIYLSEPTLLPIPNIPILGRIGAQDSEDKIGRTLKKICRLPEGGALVVDAGSDPAQVKELGNKLLHIFENDSISKPIVLFTKDNIGKVLGNYATDWGRLKVPLAVIDEISTEGAKFACLGPLKNQIVSVSFYGLKR